jgi:hypothetical protein
MPASGPSVEALTRLLEGLIVSAQNRIDGAVIIMGQSADEAEAYREALTDEAEVLLGAQLGDQVTAALVGVTRSMVARARGAEERLRSMGPNWRRCSVILRRRAIPQSGTSLPACRTAARSRRFSCVR